MKPDGRRLFSIVFVATMCVFEFESNTNIINVQPVQVVTPLPPGLSVIRGQGG